MALIVQKYGGTSVGTPERIRSVAERVARTQHEGHHVAVVVSAMEGVTDNLIKLAHQIVQDPSAREMDMLLATGEQASVALLAMALHAIGVRAVSLTGAQAGIVSDGVHTKAKILNITPTKVRQILQEENVAIVAGFQGVSLTGDITTLGRGGSDLTAIALAAALKADKCEIYTDVDGVFTADPRLVGNARKLEEISYDEMLEMASLGSKIMQARSVEFAKKFGVVFEVRSSFNYNPGTLVKEETKGMETVVVRGVTVEKNQAKITVAQVPDRPGIAAKIFHAVSEANINVDMIVQNVSENGATDISFTIHKDDVKRALQTLQPVLTEIGATTVRSQGDIAKVSVVGIGMRSHSGVAAQMFEALAAAGVNIQMISTSEIKTTCVIDQASADKALAVVHEKFELGKK